MTGDEKDTQCRKRKVKLISYGTRRIKRKYKEIKQ
jgi:hypothetical protein